MHTAQCYGCKNSMRTQEVHEPEKTQGKLLKSRDSASGSHFTFTHPDPPTGHNPADELALQPERHRRLKREG